MEKRQCTFGVSSCQTLLLSCPIVLLSCTGYVTQSGRLPKLHIVFLAGVDTMEKGALVGMMALAVSDLLFCAVTLSGSYLPGTRLVYLTRDFTFYYTLYGNCVQNILIKTSTWFTVIMAASRYFVVSQPIKARQYMRCGHTVGAIVLCLVFWILFKIPMAFQWKYHTLECPSGPMYVLDDMGPFRENRKLKLSFTYLWATLGFFIPVGILGYCNIKLIFSLRSSKKIRKHSLKTDLTTQTLSPDGTTISQPKTNRSVKQAEKNQRRITYTLIAIVLMFFICVCPSEVIQLLIDLEVEKSDTSHGNFRFAVFASNLLQALNSSSNFTLYCVVNAYFRKTMQRWLLRCVGRRPSPSSRWNRFDSTRDSASKMSLSTRTSYTLSSRASFSPSATHV